MAGDLECADVSKVSENRLLQYRVGPVLVDTLETVASIMPTVVLSCKQTIAQCKDAFIMN